MEKPVVTYDRSQGLQLAFCLFIVFMTYENMIFFIIYIHFFIIYI